MANLPAKTWDKAFDEVTDFTHIIVDNGTKKGKKIPKDTAKAIFSSAGAQLEALTGGTEAAPTTLVNPGTTDYRFRKASPGVYRWNGVNLTANDGYDWILEWKSSNWVLTRFSSVPDNAPKAWIAQSYVTGKQVYKDGQVWEANAATVAGDVPGVSTKWTARTEGAIKPWVAQAYPSGKQVIHNNTLYEANVATVAGDVPGVSAKWTVRLSPGSSGNPELLTRKNILLLEDGRELTDSGSVSTEKIDVVVGDVFLFRGMKKGVSGSNLVNNGIMGYDETGALVLPSNKAEFRYMYVHRDANIKKVAFCCASKGDWSTVKKASREDAVNIYQKDRVIYDNFFLARRSNALSGIANGQFFGKTNFPITVGLQSKTAASSAETDLNVFQIEPIYAYLSNVNPIVTGNVTIMLKSIATAGVDTVKISCGVSNIDMKVGDVRKFMLSYNGQTDELSKIIKITTPNTAVLTDYVIEIQSIGLSVHPELSVFAPRESVGFARNAVNIVNPFWVGEMWTAMGDSITAGDGYRTPVAKTLGLRMTNLAQGGAHLRDLLRLEKLQQIPRDTAIITITGGTNGVYSESNDITTRDQTYTYGQLNFAIDYIRANHPKAYLAIMTPNMVVAAERNNNILKIGQAMRDICRYRIVPLWDWQMDCGWNEQNFIHFGSDQIHPDDKYFQWMAGYVISKFPKPLYNDLHPTLFRDFNIVKD